MKFKVDYNDVRPTFRAIETEQDEKKLSAAENKHALLHPDRIKEISQYILENFNRKTHRLAGNQSGFNAMFAVSSVDAAKLYYETLNQLQADSSRSLKIATIFSFAANEEQDAIGDIHDESFDVSAMNSTGKEFLGAAIDDYNQLFKTNFSVDSSSFQNYYRDLASRVKSKEVDLLIVVGMFLTGFDAPTLNTLFVDKNLRYHGLMQAFSRTNRIYDATKAFGNIVAFRDLETATIDAITLFGNANTKNVVLEKSYEQYMEGFQGPEGARRGFLDIVQELQQRFPDHSDLESESDKRDFAKLFGEYLKAENVLQNYDEFAALKALQEVDTDDDKALAAFAEAHHLSESEVAEMAAVDLPSERKIQDYRSTYNDIRDWLRNQRTADEKEKSNIEWDDVVFEVDLLKSQEINLDYILGLLFEKKQTVDDKSDLVNDARRLIRSSLGSRAKEGLLVEFINQTDLNQLQDRASVIDAFFSFARSEQDRELSALIDDENLNVDATKRYISTSLKREFASENGADLNAILPKMSPLNPEFQSKKKSVFEKVSFFVEKFKGVGAKL